MKVSDIISKWFSNAPEEPVAPPADTQLHAKDSGPVPTGPLTITLSPAVGENEPRHLSDLNVILVPGVAIDMGHYFTQKQILDSQDLKRYIDTGIVTIDLVGTVPSPEPITVSGIVIPPLDVDISETSDSVLIYGTDGVDHQPILTSDTGIVQVDLNGISGAATEATLAKIALGMGAVGENTFDVQAIPSGVETVVHAAIDVMPGTEYMIQEVLIWGSREVELFVYANGVQIGGGRSSAAVPTLHIDYAIPLRVEGGLTGAVITFKALHYGPTAYVFKSNVSGMVTPPVI